MLCHHMMVSWAYKSYCPLTVNSKEKGTISMNRKNTDSRSTSTFDVNIVINMYISVYCLLKKRSTPHWNVWSFPKVNMVMGLNIPVNLPVNEMEGSGIAKSNPDLDSPRCCGVIWNRFYMQGIPQTLHSWKKICMEWEKIPLGWCQIYLDCY